MALRVPWDLKTPVFMHPLPDAVRARWLALDKVFVGYLAARSLKLKVVAAQATDRETLEAYVQRLLPNLFEKGMLEVPRIAQV